MLKLWLNRKPGDTIITGIRSFFMSVYEPDWITTDFSKELIKDIDKSEVINSGVIDNPFLGLMPPEKLAGGTQRILCLKYYDFTRSDLMMDITGCGDDCAKWIQRVAVEKDIEVRLEYLMEFIDTEPFDILIMETGTRCRNFREFMHAYAGVRTW